MTRRRDSPRFVALLGFFGVVLAAIITGVFLLISQRSSETRPLPESGQTANLQGVVMDRSGKGLGDLSVSVHDGPQTDVDDQGTFVLKNVPAGDQVVIVRSSRNVAGELKQGVRLESGKTTQMSIVYDSGSSRIGLLSISAPVDGSRIEVPLVRNGGLITVHGRCDGLAQIFDRFDVWVLVKPQGNAPFFVQHPAAIVDPNNNSWRCDVSLGDTTHPPTEGSHWTLVVVAAPVGSSLSRIANTPDLSKLTEQHIRSNVVTFTSSIRESKR